MVATYSDKADFRKIYINGHLVGNRKLQSLVDEVAFYDVTLNNEEVWTLFGKGVPGLPVRQCRQNTLS